MKWPRGKYNGQRIVGIEVVLRVRLDFWRLTASWNFGDPCVLIGPLRIGARAVYAWERRGARG